MRSWEGEERNSREEVWITVVLCLFPSLLTGHGKGQAFNPTGMVPFALILGSCRVRFDDLNRFTM